MRQTVYNPKVFLVDDHPMTLLGLRQRLEKAGITNIVGDSASSTEALEKIRACNPEVVITDISLEEGSGMELTRRIRAEYPDVKIIVFSMHDDYEYISAFVDLGVMGYVLKSEPPDDLIDAVHYAVENRFFVGRKIAGKILRNKIDSGVKGVDSKVAELSPSELQVLKLIAAGLKNQEIADQLFCGLRTVEGHREMLMKKLDIHSIAGLTKFAIKYGLTKLD